VPVVFYLPNKPDIIAIIGGVERFKLAHSTNSKIDRKVLQELFPEAFEATLVKTPYTFIKTI
jgi:hypothetical protein